MYDFELRPQGCVLVVAVLEQKLMLDTVKSTFKVFLKKRRFVVLIQRFALAKVVLHEKAISRTHQNRYSILETWLKLLLSIRFASVWPIQSHFDLD